MQPCLKRIKPMPNVPLAYVSVYQRMRAIFHTLTYASTIHNSVTAPFEGNTPESYRFEENIYLQRSTCLMMTNNKREMLLIPGITRTVHPK